MKLTCNSSLEAPLINLIKLNDSLHVQGLCGILTPGSKHNVEHTTIGAMALLSYCNELEVSDSLKDKIKMIDIRLEKGPVNYFGIANASGGILSVPKHLSSEPFAMATNSIRFKLLIGRTTANETLTEEDVYTFVTNANTKGYEFTAVPLPLMSKRVLQFSVTRSEGMSAIQCDAVSDKAIEALFSSLKVE